MICSKSYLKISIKLLVLFIQLRPACSLQAQDDCAKEHRSLRDSSSAFLLLRKPFPYLSCYKPQENPALLFRQLHGHTTPGKSLVQSALTPWLKVYLKIHYTKTLALIKPTGELLKTNRLSSKKQLDGIYSCTQYFSS